MSNIAQNPLCATSGIPDFSAIKPAHVTPAVDHGITGIAASLPQLEAKLDAILHSGQIPTWEDVGPPLHTIERVFGYMWGPVAHLLSVANCDELRHAFTENQSKIVDISLRISQSKTIFRAFESIKSDTATFESMPTAQQRAIEKRLRDAILSGVGLEGEQKSRFLQIQRRLSALATDFSNHVVDASNAFELIFTDANKTKGWTPLLKRIAAGNYQKRKDENADTETGPWLITLDGPCMMSFMQHHCDSADRKIVWEASNTLCSKGDYDNTTIAEETLALRQEKAELLGFANYAELSTSSKMSGNPDAVWQLYKDLEAVCVPAAKQEYRDLQNFANTQGFTGELMPWDSGFYSERYREELFAFTDEEIRPYFTLENVMSSLNTLCQEIFGVRFVAGSESEMPIWHEDVQCWNVEDITSGKHIASFYLDPYTRSGVKNGGAWVNTCNSRENIDGKIQLPVTFIICNGSEPSDGIPSLMNFNEIITLYHEFGHALQAMLTEQDIVDVTCLNGIEWDAVEIASQFMENWCYHKPVLMGMSGHYETGEKLPEDLFEKIMAARTYRSGSAFVGQIVYGATDMYIHSHGLQGRKLEDIYEEIHNRISPTKMMPCVRRLNSFSHIFAGGYSAGYYSYKWSEVLSADCFEAFEDVGLDNPEAIAKLGRKLRDTLFALGGSVHPSDVIFELLGRAPRTDALLRHNNLK